VASEDATHWGLAADGYLSACGGEGRRRTAVRLVTCQYCLNIIDRCISERAITRKGKPPFVFKPRRRRGTP
jgi:hypothetical protein